MKTNYKIILVTALVLTVMLVSGQYGRAAGPKDRQGALEERPARGRMRWFEPTDEAIERIMSRLKEDDPNKAEELARLRTDDPQKFKVELRKAMAERFSARLRGRMRPGPDSRMGLEQHKRRGHPEYEEWLAENYPNKAEKLGRDAERGHKRFRRIWQAEKDNPELARILKQDVELKAKRNKLLSEIRACSDEAEKKELLEELRGVIGNRFDLLVQRKQMEYERLHKRLARLQKRLEKSEAELEKWKDTEFKSENVKARLEKLVRESEEFRWE